MRRVIFFRLAIAGVILAVVAGCAGAPKGISFPNETFSAEQLYKRRADLNGKTVHALVLWQYNFEVCDTAYRSPEGFYYLEGIRFRSDQLSKSSSVQWHTVDHLCSEYWRAVHRSLSLPPPPPGESNGPGDLWYWLDADVTVKTLPNENVIWGPMMYLEVSVIRTIRLGERL